MDRAQLAQENDKIVTRLQNVKTNSRVYSPSQLEMLQINKVNKQSNRCTIEVTKEKSTEALTRLAEKYPNDDNVCVLNFASAKNPGGGYRWGAKAQEEDLCLSSNLYYELIQDSCKSYYTGQHFFMNQNKKTWKPYSNFMIYSSNVRFFRSTDTYGLLRKQYDASVVTAAAPNLNIPLFHGFKTQAEIADYWYLFRQRIENILNVMEVNGCTNLVLGCFGCGVFRNNPETVARLFKEALAKNNKFQHIVFACYGPKENYESFLNEFQGNLGDVLAPILGPNFFSTKQQQNQKTPSFSNDDFPPLSNLHQPQKENKS